MRVILIALVVIGALAAAQPEASSPEATSLAVERLTLANGQQLVGIYDRASAKLVIIHEKTGKRIGEVAVKAEDVTKAEAFAITLNANAQAPAGGNGRWLVDYAKARDVAKQLKRPLLIDFTGSDWCGWCVKLEEEVFTRKEFQTWAKERVVLLKIDFPRRTPLPPLVAATNQKLAQQFAVSGYPTVLLVDPESETSLRKWGYFAGGPQKWVEGMVGGVPGLEKLGWVAEK